jgi:hypothetical protein
MPFLRQKSLAGYNHHPSQQPTLSLSAPGSASTSPPCTPLSCMQLLSCCQACQSLPSISSPTPLLLLALIASLVSLAAPLASVAATACKLVPRVSASSKSYERKQKGDIYMYHFHDEIKSQNRFFGCHEASNTQIWILFPATVAPP